MSRHEDEDGIDGPLDKAWRAAMREDGALKRGRVPKVATKAKTTHRKRTHANGEDTPACISLRYTERKAWAYAADNEAPTCKRCLAESQHAAEFHAYMQQHRSRP
jgi:hypothetical protein